MKYSNLLESRFIGLYLVIHLFYLILANDVNVVLFQSYRQGPLFLRVGLGVLLRVLDRSDFIIANKILAKFAIMLTIELVFIETALVGNLVRHKLGVVSGSNTLVNYLILLEALLDRSVLKLCHLGIVGEHVQRQVLALSDGDEFFLVVILVSVLLILNVDEESLLGPGSLESRQRCD